MRTLRNKKTIKKILITIFIITVLSTLTPALVKAKTDTENGGKILAPIADFVLFLCDNVMQFLQNIFISIESIDRGDGTYDFQYSPAIIFSGTVPALDINFIEPNTYSKDSSSYGQYVRNNIPTYFTSKNDSDKSQYENAKTRNDAYVISGGVPLQQANSTYTAYYWVENGTLHIACEFDAGWGIYIFRSRYTYYYTSCSVDDPEVQTAAEKVSYSSVASELQPTIATWYNVLRKIALVGLLSVLVYIGIRIVISSSAGEKAKYKAMIKDWVVAICLLFTLHYIMSITITVTNEISDIFETGDTDQLLNTLRETIFSTKDRGIVLANTIMYLVLVILTVIFTVQYIKRVVFMAFYTLIAPLITLTYPLDKIKDGQAQAFVMWIREYVYTALIQVVHLVIYTVLVGSALELVTSYPLYAIVVILFIRKADEIIKKMFGFDKSETVGTLGAAATGALLVNAMSKLRKRWRK